MHNAAALAKLNSTTVEPIAPPVMKRAKPDVGGKLPLGGETKLAADEISKVFSDAGKGVEALSEGTSQTKLQGFKFTAAEEKSILQHFSQSEELKKSEYKRTGGQGGVSQYAVQAEGSDFDVVVQIPQTISKEKAKIILQVAKELSTLARSDVPDQSVQGFPVDDLVIGIMHAGPNEHLGYDMGTIPQGKAGGDPKRHAFQVVMMPADVNTQDNDLFKGLVRHEFMHAMGISIPGTQWDQLTETQPNGDRVYTGEKGLDAFARLHGLAQTPTSFPLVTVGGDHLPPFSYDTMSQDPHSLVKDGGAFSGLDEAILADLGYDAAPATFDKLIALPKDVALWKPENSLTSANGKFEASFDSTGDVVIKNLADGGETRHQVATDKAGAPFELTVSSEGALSLRSGAGQETLVRENNHPQNTITTSAISVSDAGDVQVSDIKKGTTRKPGTKEVNVNVLFSYSQAKTGKDEL